MSSTDEGNKMSKLKLVLAVFLVSLSLSACDGGQQAGPRQSTPEVSVVTVQAQQITEVAELPGRTAAFLIAEIRPRINGLIEKRLFTEGSDVQAGQVLYQIDPAPFQAALDNAVAALGRAKANLPSVKLRAERYKTLLEAKAVSQQDYDDAAAALGLTEADIRYYEASVKTARINLGYTKVVAPISGRIGRSTVTDGAIVTAYQPSALATIQQLNPIYVDVPQSTSELLRLRRSLKEGHLNLDGDEQNQVKLILEDGTPYPQQGTLQFRDVSVDPTTGSVILRMVFPNPDGTLLPEMFVRAVVVQGVNKKAILVPQQAVLRNQKGSPFAYVVGADNKVALRMLTADRAIGDNWLISDGIVSGDRVIVEGLQRVRPGAEVKVVPFNKTEEAKPGNEAQPKAESK